MGEDRQVTGPPENQARLSTVKRLLTTIFLFEAFAISLLFITIWFIVSVNNLELTLTVTAYGERTVEYFMWLVLTPILVLGFHYSLELVRS